MNNAKHFIALVAFCTGILSLQAQELKFDAPEQMSDAVNSSLSEESMPLLSKDGKTMYFVRSFHPDNQGGVNGGHDIWYSTKNDDGTWTPASNNLGILNNKTNNAVAGVSEDGTTIYLINTYEGKNKSGIGVSKSTLTDGNWSKPETIKIPGINPVNDFYSFYITPEEDVLLISMEDNFSKGKNDLYLAVKDQQGSWNVPANLGNMINTEMDEISPYLSPDRTRLYFSTNGRGGMGGYDVFYSERQGDSWTDWGMPVNVTSVNSGDFDAYFSIYESGDVYFCSSRNDTIANIYRTRISDPEDEDDDEIIAEETDIEDGELRDSDIIEDDSIEVVGADTDPIDPKDQILKNQALDNIYFDYDKYFLRAKSKEVLDVVIKELKKDESISVRLVGHCDNRGSQEYNLPLSMNRANAAREYLESNGIASNRIDTDGKGKKQPAASNDTEEGRQLNRRVEVYFK